MIADTSIPTEERAPHETRQVLAWHEERDEYFVAELGEVAAQLDSTPEGIIDGIRSGDAINGCFVDWAAPTQQQLNSSQNHKMKP
jgi:hypothetical protein